MGVIFPKINIWGIVLVEFFSATWFVIYGIFGLNGWVSILVSLVLSLSINYYFLIQSKILVKSEYCKLKKIDYLFIVINTIGFIYMCAHMIKNIDLTINNL